MSLKLSRDVLICDVPGSFSFLFAAFFNLALQVSALAKVKQSQALQVLEVRNLDGVPHEERRC